MGLADVLEPGREPETFALADTLQIELLDEEAPPSSGPIVVSARYGRPRCVVPVAFPPPRDRVQERAFARTSNVRMTTARLALVCMGALVVAAAGGAWLLAREMPLHAAKSMAENVTQPAENRNAASDANGNVNATANIADARTQGSRKPTAAPRAASAARSGRR